MPLLVAYWSFPLDGMLLLRKVNLSTSFKESPVRVEMFPVVFFFCFFIKTHVLCLL